MIVSSDDIKAVELLVEEMYRCAASPEGEAEKGLHDPVFFANHPHLIMLLGYDEFRALDWQGIEDATPFAERGATLDKITAGIEAFYGLRNFVPAYSYESLYREATSGSWYWYEGISPAGLWLQGPTELLDQLFLIDEFLLLLKKAHKQADAVKRTLWLPGTWTPAVQNEQRILLAESVSDLLAAIESEKTSLQEIPWRKLEELVAELLRFRGLQVSVTPKAGDGGRDIIARGELIPGEPTLLAVEVKQKPVVGLADVQRALRANEDFPTLMLATAGRFSAGVVQEKNRTRNRLRLFLKDGVALTQWIHGYMSGRHHK
jgi:restriction endonuclease